MTDTDEPEGVIILVGEDEEHTADSIRFTADCGHVCWIGPETLRMHYAPEPVTTTKCTECSGMNFREMLIMAAQGRVGAIPGARESLAAEIGEEKTNALYRLMGLGGDQV